MTKAELEHKYHCACQALDEIDDVLDSDKTDEDKLEAVGLILFGADELDVFND